MRCAGLMFFFIINSALFQKALGQSELINNKLCFDTVDASGYYVYVYTKKEINELEKNKLRKAAGKSFAISINDEYKEFFIPADSIAGRNSFPALLNGLMVKDKNNIFIQSSSLNKYSLDEFNIGCLKYLKASSPWPQFISNELYITSSKKSKYCFQIFALSARWAKISLPQEAINELIARKGKYLNPAASLYDLYIFKELLSDSTVLSSSNMPIKMWKKFPSFW